METKKSTTKKKVAALKKVAVKTSAAKKKTSTASKSKPKVIVVKKTSKATFKKAPVKQKSISAVKSNVHAKKIGGGKRTLVKRSVYMILSVVFGTLLGVFVSLFLELVYIKKMIGSNEVMTVNSVMGISTILPGFAEIFFALAGAIFGVWLGFWGWRFVYIERRHRSTRIQ